MYKLEEFKSDIKSRKISTEEEVRIALVRLIESELGIVIKQAERKTTEGRTDLIYHNKVIELKKPFTFQNEKLFLETKNQSSRYLNNEYNRALEFDGVYFSFSDSMTKYELDEENFILIEQFLKDDLKYTKISLQDIFNPLNKGNKQLLNLLVKEAEQFTQNSSEYIEWKKLFSISSHDLKEDKSYLASLKNSELIEIFGNGHDLQLCLFSLHTFFAFIVKNITTFNIEKYVSEMGRIGPKKIDPFSSLETFESGSFYTDIGILNMFSNDVFSWYIKASKELKSGMINFRENVLFRFGKLESQDFIEDIFNVVYETVIPHNVRKSLGEYYTPPHFAREVLDFGNVDFSKKIIDPTCGSGTFVNVVLEKKLDMGLSLEEIMKSIMGVDINLVAIIAAKANFLLRILSSVKNYQKILVPLFNVDSTVIQDKFNFLKKIDLHIQNFDFEIKTNIFNYLESNIDSDSLDIILTKILQDASDVQLALNELKRIKSNYLKTFSYSLRQDSKVKAYCMNDFDYIIGNPPWVKWSNLPSKYREELKNRGFDALFSPYKNSGGNSLDLYAPILMASAKNYLSKDGEIVMIMPMSLNFNSSLETVRHFSFLGNKTNRRINKIKEYHSKNQVFKDVDISFGIYVITNKQESKYIYVDKSGREHLKVPYTNPLTKTIIPFDSHKELEEAKQYMGIRSEKYKVRSGVQFSPLKLRQFKKVDEVDGIVTLTSATPRKEQKSGIDKITIYAEKESVKQILRTKNLRKDDSEKLYCWWLYKDGTKIEYTLEEINRKFPILWRSLMENKKILQPDNNSKFNSRISKSSWYGNTRVGNYTQAPYRICFSDNGIFNPVLITDINIIPEGHVRFIPIYEKEDAYRIMEILSKSIVKKMMNIQYLNLNKSFLPKYMWIKF